MRQGLSNCARIVTGDVKPETPPGYDKRVRGDEYFHQFKNPRQPINTLELAINEYIQAVELEEDLRITVQMARAYMLNGRFSTADQLIRKVQQKAPLHSDIQKNILEIQAFLYFRQGHYQQAKACLSQALKKEKCWRAAKLHFGMVGIAMEFLRKKWQPTLLLGGLFHFLVGSLLYCLFEPKTIIKPFMTIFFLIVFNRFCNPEKWLESCLALYREYPGYLYLPIAIGKQYMQQEQYSEAEFWFSKVIARYPARDEGYQALANLYQQTNNTEQLIDVLQRWLTIRPNSGEIWLILSQALAQSTDRYEEAIAAAKQALLLLNQPTMLSNAYVHIGNLYASIQLWDAAIMAYHSAIQIYPGALDTYISLGTLYYDKQEYHLSQKVFEAALALSPDNAKILCNLGYLAWMQGNIPVALYYYQKSVEQDPTYDIALNNLGVLYLDHIGNIQAAMALFDQTLLHNPYYALCYYNKGRAYSFLGKTIEAARCYRQAQDLNERSQELDSQELTDRIKQLFEDTEQRQ